MRAQGCAADYSSSLFETEDVHRIAILDIRILNADRNEGNLLVEEHEKEEPGPEPQNDLLIRENSERSAARRRRRLRLVPIDHGLSISSSAKICMHEIVWMDYPQVKQPLSRESLDFIEQIDPCADTTLLRDKLGFREICLRNFRCAGIFLKRCAQGGFTLFEMGNFLYRAEDENGDYEEPSQFEKLLEESENLYKLTWTQPKFHNKLLHLVKL